jgi:hypothetical protein
VLETALERGADEEGPTAEAGPEVAGERCLVRCQLRGRDLRRGLRELGWSDLDRGGDQG